MADSVIHLKKQIAKKDAELERLSKELLRVNQTKGTELYQPVPMPEVQTWHLIRRCKDRFVMILKFLGQKLLLQQKWRQNRFAAAEDRQRQGHK